MRRLTHAFRQRKSRAYYVALICGLGLCWGLGLLIITGQGLVPDDSDLAVGLHESPLVMDGDHNHTILGDLLLGKPAEAHKYPYCGGGTIWPRIDGVLHRVKHLWWYDNGDNRIRTDHYDWRGTAYVRVDGSRQDYRIDC